MSENKKGTLIVFEGGDGSGKGTQSQLLLEYFKQNNIPHAYFDFPQYDTFYGQVVAQFLRGEFGPLDSVSPYLAALTFALDRSAVRGEIVKHLDRGEVAIANRYVTSNIAHQGSKFADEKKRDAFISWVERLEYEEHGMPRADIVIYLKCPENISAELTKKKEKRSYLNGKKEDIQEEDGEHRRLAQSMYDIISHRSKNWITLECVKNGTIRTKVDIHKQVVQTLKEKNII